MSIDDKTVDRIAALARLSFDDNEKKKIGTDLEKILKFVDTLNEIDTEGVEPLIYVNENRGEMRKDLVDHVVSQEEALRNAPDKDSDYIKVPKVLNRD